MKLYLLPATLVLLLILLGGCVRATGGLNVAQSPEITHTRLAQPLIGADLGTVTVDLSSPEKTIPDDYGEPWMYFGLLNKPEDGWFVDVQVAVEQSLRQSGIFQQGAGSRIRVEASLVEMVDHATAYDMDLTFGMRYRLVDEADNLLFDQVITTRGFASVGEYFSGFTRSIVGTERALTANLQSLLTQLQTEIPRYQAERERKRDILARAGRDLTAKVGTYRVVAAEALIRSIPEAGGTVIDKVAQGGVVETLGALPDGWLHVSRDGGPVGWVARDSLEPAQAISLGGSARTVQFPKDPMQIAFRPGPVRPNDIAVIIGNADYSGSGKDIPDVMPAYADAEGFKRYAQTALGVREGNIIDMRDATQSDMISVFGSQEDHRGKLFNWIRPEISRVIVYFSGHGAPGLDGNAYLVPSDADPAALRLNGYRLDHLYGNLAKSRAQSVTVVLEACFSGASPEGSIISNASPVFMKTRPIKVPESLSVIAAGAGNQMASWEQDGSHGLFTKYYLLAMSGEADRAPNGNGDGRISAEELQVYLDRTMTYYARRYYGRDQRAQLMGDAFK